MPFDRLRAHVWAELVEAQRPYLLDMLRAFMG
jgi:hypothetical protein